jgi:hypothetical protein
LQPPAQPLLSPQQLLQLLQLEQLLQHDFLQWNRPLNKPQCFFLQQPLLQLLQAGASQQVGSAAQQAGSQAGAAQQVGSQAGAQQLFLQLWQPPNRPWQPPNRPQCFFLQQPVLQLLQLSQAEASQHVGSAAQQVGAAAQHVGSAAQQDGSASQHEASQQLLQPPHPPEEAPSKRSRSSKPKLWLHKPTLTTSAPKSMFHFIDQRLLCNELRAAGHAVLTNATSYTVFQSSEWLALIRGLVLPLLSGVEPDCGGYAWRSQEGSLGRNPQFKPFCIEGRRTIPWLDV